jgi:hypothetical protein
MSARPKQSNKSAATKTRAKARPSAPAAEPEISLPPAHDWRTTDEDEVNRRRLRAREESFIIRNQDARFPVYSNFSVGSGSGLTYAVEIRDVANRQFACTCQDFRKNGLGTEARLPEPVAVGEISAPPLAATWGPHAPAILEFIAQPEAGGAEVLRAMEDLAGVADDCPF